VSRITADMIRRIAALGLEDTSALVKAAEFVELRPDGLHELHCILCGFEAPGATPFNEAFPLVMNALVPERREPANDRTRRFNSAEKAKLYYTLCERDGEWCAECKCKPYTIWRRNGTCSSSSYGSHPHTIVYPTPNLEIDHRTPLWAGGTNDLENLWLLCIECHKAKTAKEASQRRRA